MTQLSNYDSITSFATEILAHYLHSSGLLIRNRVLTNTDSKM